jgi:hypothetical protein
MFSGPPEDVAERSWQQWVATPSGADWMAKWYPGCRKPPQLSKVKYLEWLETPKGDAWLADRQRGDHPEGPAANVAAASTLVCSEAAFRTEDSGQNPVASGALEDDKASDHPSDEELLEIAAAFEESRKSDPGADKVATPSDESSAKRMKPNEANSILWLQEFIDTTVIQQDLRLPGIDGIKKKGGLYDHTHELKQVLESFLARADDSSTVSVSYREDNLCMAVGCQGRLMSSGGAFGLPKVFRQLLRGGLKQDFRDYDMKASFPRAMAARHPWAIHIRKWIDGQLKLEGFPRDVIKSFINICPGVGDAGVKQWCADQGLPSLPGVLCNYLADVRKAAEIDLADNSDMANKLITHDPERFKSRYNLKNAIVYVLNSMWERDQLEKASQRLRGLATVHSIEYDGLWIQLSLGKTWEQVEAALAEGFSNKPYPHVEVLLGEVGLEMPMNPRPQDDAHELLNSQDEARIVC